jgi:hypothetical protein
MFSKRKNKNKGEDLNQRMEKFKKWWQDQTQDLSRDRSNSSKINKRNDKSCDSCFVYNDEN